MRTQRGHSGSSNWEGTGDIGKISFGGAVGPKPDWSGSKREGEGRDGRLISRILSSREQRGVAGEGGVTERALL